MINFYGLIDVAFKAVMGCLMYLFLTWLGVSDMVLMVGTAVMVATSSVSVNGERVN